MHLFYDCVFKYFSFYIIIQIAELYKQFSCAGCLAEAAAQIGFEKRKLLQGERAVWEESARFQSSCASTQAAWVFKLYNTFTELSIFGEKKVQAICLYGTRRRKCRELLFEKSKGIWYNKLLYKI